MGATLNTLNELGEKASKRLYDGIIKSLPDFNKGNLKNPLKMGMEYQDSDNLYQIIVTMKREEKHTCEECIYYRNEDCGFNNYVASLDVKKYCKLYETEKRCWDCTHQVSYGSDDNWCGIDSTMDYYRNYNEDGKCPYFEVDV